MHPTLLQANQALYAGDRAQVRRLLDSYSPQENTDLDVRLWLEAHAQAEHERFLGKLYELVENAPANSPYVQMARRYLDDEEEYRLRLETRTARRNWGAWLIPLATFVLGGVLVLFIADGVNSRREPQTLVVTATPEVASLAEATEALEDRSERLLAEQYSVRYEQGILQIAAYEDRSQRVRSERSDALETPVPGARFFALEIVFECRGGICRQPPEAELFIELDNGNWIEARTDVYIAGDAGLQAIALGRTTSGWQIFEIPTINRPQALVVVPNSPDDSITEAAPLRIELPPL